MDQPFECIDGPLKARLEQVHVRFGNGFQHVIRRVLARGRTSDPDLDSHKLLRSQALNNGPNAIMSPMPTGKLDPKTPRFEIEIVMHKDKIVGGEFQFAEQAFEGGTGDVHEVEGAGEFDQFGTEPPRPSLSYTAPGKPNRPSSRSLLDDPHPGIVAGLGVRGARIAQSNDEAHGYFFFSVSFFSAFGAPAASFFSPAFTSPAGAAAPAFAASAPSTPSAATLPFAATSGSFAPSAPAA